MVISLPVPQIKSAYQYVACLQLENSEYWLIWSAQMYRIFLSILENKYLFQILGGLTSKFQPDRFSKTKFLLVGFYPELHSTLKEPAVLTY